MLVNITACETLLGYFMSKSNNYDHKLYSGGVLMV